ncbi:MAG: response regulator [Desulfobacterales bacterium]|nr:response regulator [Desulfobacterales bacterium]
MERKKKLLIADDDNYAHDLLVEFLPVNELDIIHAYDGEETLKLAEEQMPDLIVLDVMMPLMDGRDVCKKLKNDPKTRDIRIIMLTGRDQQSDRILGLELGADDYVTKPCSMTYLARKIQRALSEPVD